jgi:HD-like signal output (HDOD) protein
MLRQPECEVDAVARLIMSDAALATAVLRVSNSSFYRGLDKTLSVSDAIMRLGMRTVTSLVTLLGHKKAYHLREATLQPYIRVLWRHAIAAAVGTHWLVRQNWRQLD